MITSIDPEMFDSVWSRASFQILLLSNLLLLVSSEESGCTAFEFRCADKSCIDLYKLCDGDNDCADGSDETKCGNQSKLALPLMFRCKNGQLIWGSWRCDGKVNCMDQSDEENCVKGRCNSFQYRCNNGECVYGLDVCDGKRDSCEDGSDEDEALCSKLRGKCTPWRFRCANGKCVDGALRCGFHHDCTDRSDEYNCKQKNALENGNGECEYHRRWWNFNCNETKKCYRTEEICDDVKKCQLSHLDETNCGEFICPAGEMQCDNGMCLLQSAKCDGRNDCGDGSDEWNCPKQQSTSECGGFQCDSGLCIQKSARCDGILQCPDASDEWECGGWHPKNSSRTMTTTMPEISQPGSQAAMQETDDMHSGINKLITITTVILILLVLFLVTLIVLGFAWINLRRGQVATDLQMLFVRGEGSS